LLQLEKDNPKVNAIYVMRGAVEGNILMAVMTVVAHGMEKM